LYLPSELLFKAVTYSVIPASGTAHAQASGVDFKDKYLVLNY